MDARSATCRGVANDLLAFSEHIDMDIEPGTAGLAPIGLDREYHLRVARHLRQTGFLKVEEGGMIIHPVPLSRVHSRCHMFLSRLEHGVVSPLHMNVRLQRANSQRLAEAGQRRKGNLERERESCMFLYHASTALAFCAMGNRGQSGMPMTNKSASPRSLW